MTTEVFSKKIRVGLTIVVCLAWFCGVLWIMKTILFDPNAPLTSENTYQITIPTSEITFEVKRLDSISWRASDWEHLYMYVGSDCYYVEWYNASLLSAGRGERLEDLSQLKAEPELTLTVFEDAAVLGNKLSVVDVRSPTRVYFDSDIIEVRHKKNRKAFPVAILVFALFFVMGICLICRKLLPREYRKPFDRIDAVFKKVLKKGRRKKKSKRPVVPTETPPQEKRTPSEGALFRDEE